MRDNFPKRGEIYWVRLDPTNGKEIKKTRPCLIISGNIANRSDLIVIAPITSKVDRIFEKIEVKIILNGTVGKVVLRQMRSVDKFIRLGDRIGAIPIKEMKLVDDAIRLILDI